MKQSGSIKWERYIDRIFCVYFLPNKKRMARLKDELNRVGILDSPIFEWRFTTPNPYDVVIQNNYKDKKWINSIGCINGSLEVLRILKESRLLGYKRILILEDDVAFLKDLSALEKILSYIPEGYDIVQLDKGCWGKSKIEEWNSIRNNTINECFVEAGQFHFGLSDANVFTPSGMDLAIRVLDSKPIACDQLNYEGIFRTAIARENACIQVFFRNSNYNNGVGCHRIYQDIGIDYRKYNLPIGYGYNTLYDPQEGNTYGLQKNSKKTQIAKPKNRWDIFDYVGVICFTGYQDRIKELMPELERIGLREKVHLHWDTPSAFRDKLFAAVKKTSFCSKGGCFNMAVQHYTVIKTAYELGCNSILVLEDDVRFLNDLSLLDEMLEAIPLNYDHLMFDRNKLTDTELTSFANLTDEQKRNKWIEFSVAGSTGCYAMSRRGMRRYIELIESDVYGGKVHNPDYYFRNEKGGRVFWDNSYKRYFSYPNIAVQSIVGKNGSFSDLGDYWKNLFAAGIKQEDYNLSMQVISDKNFSSLLRESISDQDKAQREGTYDSDGNPLIDAVVGKKNRVSGSAKRADRVFIWGNLPSPTNKAMLQQSQINGSQIVLSEDGFIKSIAPCWNDCAKPFKDSHSVVFDTRAYYFDATQTSSLELMLNDFGLLISPEQRAEARRLIDRIVSCKISRFNHQPITKANIGRDGKRKVLVIDQTEGDYNVSLALADKDTFKRMLETATKENPDADIVVKSHPYAVAGIKGYFNDLTENDNIYRYTAPINPYSLMESCDKVYVVSSQFGLEALMAGKEVHVFGMPFYAGWGLTIDYQHLNRRTNMRTIEELFYIFYCIYTHWVDPDRGSETTIDAVIDKMIKLRAEYQRNPNAFKVTAPVNVDNMSFGGFRIGHKRKPIILPRFNTSAQKPRIKGFGW